MDNLTETAREKVDALLGRDQTLATICDWGNDIQFVRKETVAWHYINLPVRKKVYESQLGSYCKKGNCIVDQILNELEGLKDPQRVIGERNEDLKFLAHLMGDLHQPLYCSDDGDHHGRDKKIRYIAPKQETAGTCTRLLTLWDELIEVKASENPRELATKLEKTITEKERQNWVKGSPTDWAYESYLTAKKNIYIDFPAGPVDYTNRPLLDTYYTDLRPVAEEQLKKAGIRLAYLLNRYLR